MVGAALGVTLGWLASMLDYNEWVGIDLWPLWGSHG